MARIKRETIILVILLGIVLTVSSLIIFNIRKEQRTSRHDLLDPPNISFFLL